MSKLSAWLRWVRGWMGFRGEYILFSYFYRPHKQATARISASETILIDKELVTLVELLNTFKGVRTFESCQGNKVEYASVFAETTDDIIDKCSYLFAFTCKLAQILADSHRESKTLISPAYEIGLSINWSGDKKIPYLLCRFPSESIKSVTNVFVLEKTRLQCGIESIQL